MGQINWPPDLNKQLGAMKGRIKSLEIGSPRYYSEVDAQQSAASGTAFVDLGGPSITIQLPAAAFVSVYAQADIVSTAAGLHGNVYLEEQNGDFGPTEILSNGNVLATLGTALGSTNAHPPLTGPLTFPASAGTRIYTMLYGADSGCTGSFSNRKLWVWTLG